MLKFGGLSVSEHLIHIHNQTPLLPSNKHCYFQNWAIPENIHAYHGRLFGILRARGSLNWKSEGMGGYLQLEFRRHGGVLDLGFPQETDKSVFLENANFMDF